MDDLRENLESVVGLSKQESAVYLAALELGFSSISEIARKAGVKRPTAYYIIEELIKKRLMSKAPKGQRSFYLAESPHKLLNEIRSRQARLESLLPSLESLQQSASNKPKIRFYEGKNGIRSIYFEIFKTHKKIITTASMNKIYQVFSERENAEFFDLLRKEGGQIYDLLENSVEAKKYFKSAYRKGLGQVKFLPENFKFKTDTLVAGNKVALISFSSMIGVIIENEDIAETQRQFLEFMWKNL